MDADIRRKLDMAHRVLCFCRANPSSNPGLEAAVDRLEDRVGRANRCLEEELSGRLAVSNAVQVRDYLRSEMHQDLLLLTGIARAARADDPDIPRIPLPRTRTSLTAFESGVRIALELGRAHREQLETHGLPGDLLDHLAHALEQFERAAVARNRSGLAHVGAHGGMKEAIAEIMRLAQQLDRLNRHRFRHDAYQLGGWISARNVAWRGRRTDGTTGGLMIG